jgi:UDP-galactose transporter B1
MGLARKVVTLVASIYIYGHSLNGIQTLGLVVSFSAMISGFFEKKGGHGHGHGHGPPGGGGTGGAQANRPGGNNQLSLVSQQQEKERVRFESKPLLSDTDEGGADEEEGRGGAASPQPGRGGKGGGAVGKVASAPQLTRTSI